MKNDYGFPISNFPISETLPSDEEYLQQFIRWQDKQREMVFGKRIIPHVKPVPMQAAPSRPQIPQKPIIKKSRGRQIEL